MNTEPISSAAAQFGLVVRGGFAVAEEDKVPAVAGQAAAYLVLFGNVGSSMWAAFRNSDEYHDSQPHPLNRWSERIGLALGEAFSARALFPFGGPPHQPFLRWGAKAGDLQSSQLGMLIHPRFGLWHAYRFALAFAELPDTALSPPRPSADKNICQRCATKPCLAPCPVNAYTATGYDVHACYHYLQSHPDSVCMTEGCQARAACPQGVAHQYEPPHAAFHMRAFVDSMAQQKPLTNHADAIVL